MWENEEIIKHIHYFNREGICVVFIKKDILTEVIEIIDVYVKLDNRNQGIATLNIKRVTNYYLYRYKKIFTKFKKSNDLNYLKLFLNLGFSIDMNTKEIYKILK